MTIFFVKNIHSRDGDFLHGCNLNEPIILELSEQLDRLIALIPQNTATLPLVTYGVTYDPTSQIKRLLTQLKAYPLTHLHRTFMEMSKTCASTEEIMDALQRNAAGTIQSLNDNIPLFFEDTPSQAQANTILKSIASSIQACAQEAETYVISLQPDFTSNSARMV